MNGQDVKLIAMESRYGRSLEFGLSIVPASAEVELARALLRRADQLGQAERFAQEVVPRLR